MAYTALFIEVFIVGVQASTWIALLTLKFAFKVPPSTAAVWTSLNSASAVTLLVPWVYTVGILFDRLADDLFWSVAAPPILKKRRISEKHFKEACVLVIEKSGVASVDYYRYYLSRVRIVRAAVINVPLFMLSAYVVYRFDWRTYVPAASAVTLLCIWSYLTLIDRYIQRTMRIHDLILKNLLPSQVTPTH